MGFFDNLAKFGQALEEGFAPPLIRAELKARRQALADRQRQTQALSLLGDTLFPDIPSTVSPAGVQANIALANTKTPETGLNLGGSALDVLSGASSARNQAANLPNGGVIPAQDRSRERNLFGLLSTVAPEAAVGAAVQSIFPQERQGRPSLTEKVKELEALGIEMTPQRIQQLAGLAKQGADLDELVKRVELELSLGQLEDRREAKLDKGNAEKLKVREQTDALNIALGQLGDLFNANISLKGTPLETGKVLPKARNVGASVLGELGVQEAGNLFSAQNTFQKLAANVLLDSFESLKNLGVITDAKFNAIIKSQPSVDNDPITNSIIIESQIKELLAIAKREKIPIDVAGYESLLRRIELEIEAMKRGIK